MNELWTRAAAGLDSAWLGGPLPRLEGDLALLRVHCDPPTGPLGPWREAGERARRALGHGVAPGMLRGGPGRRLLEDEPTGALEEVVDVLNAYAGVAGRRRVLVFVGLEAADQGTLTALERILRRPGWLRMPLILGVRALGPPVEGVLQALQEVAGPEALLQAPVAPPPAAPLLPFEGLPGGVQRVVRAAALVGEAFTADLVGQLLDRPPQWVLERLQSAADRGWPLADDGEGHLRMPTEVVRALRQSLLPSLARAWHLRLAAVRQEVADPAPVRENSPNFAKPQDNVAEGPGPSGQAPDDETGPEPPPRAADDPAAAHLLEAGEVEASVDRLLAAARQAADLGAADQALSLGTEGLRRLAGLPRTEAQRRRRIALLATRARAQQAGGPGATLDVARQSIEAAAALLQPDDPLELQVDVAVARSTILYDIGTKEALEEALALLTQASQRLEGAGNPREAARLFNDQAAVWLRLGDPVRAHGLLAASRRLFAQQAATDPIARRELAETDLLIARLPLHVAARPGREGEATSYGLEHARLAEAAFTQLGMARQAARARETRGRLELAAGRTREAIEALQGAARAQQQLGDALGLASSVEALARALSAENQHQAALELIGESLALNAEKGSVRGTEYVRQALEGVVGHMPPPVRQQLAGAISRLSAMLAEAEGRLRRWDGDA